MFRPAVQSSNLLQANGGVCGLVSGSCAVAADLCMPPNPHQPMIDQTQLHSLHFHSVGHMLHLSLEEFNQAKMSRSGNFVGALNGGSLVVSFRFTIKVGFTVDLDLEMPCILQRYHLGPGTNRLLISCPLRSKLQHTPEAAAFQASRLS